MIAILIILLSYSTFSQVNKPAIIKGFDGKTYVKYPNEKKWIETDSVDSNYVGNSQIKVEYTNFDGETIDMSKKKPIYVSEIDDLISSINVANDPSKGHYTLYFKLREKAKVIIQVYTIDGVRISDIVWEEFESGMNRVNINKKFTKGSYVIYMTIDKEVFKHRVLFD